MSGPSSADILTRVRQAGFALAGIAPAEPSAQAQFVDQWLAAGRHGEMAYLAQQPELRLDVRRLVPGAMSIICVADAYPAEHSGNEQAESPPRGRVARYAWGRDYHQVMKDRLHDLADWLRAYHPQHTFRTTVDTAPVLEREHALRAGLGWVGKNTMLIHPQRGSWLLLGEIITTLPLQTTSSAQRVTDHCGTCTRCLDACPTQCLTPYAIDAARCLSYLTIEHRAPIDPALHDAVGNWLAGCDVCQEVCPHNDRVPTEDTQDAYQPGAAAEGFDLLTVLNWDAAARTQALTRSALKRIRLEMFKRNALIAAGNALRRQNHPALRQRVRELASDTAESELVRQTAQQVLERLSAGQ